MSTITHASLKNSGLFCLLVGALCIIKEEAVDLSNYADAYRHIGRFLDEVYMHKRIHSALGYLPRLSLRAGGWRRSSLLAK